jgi:Glycosyltransferase family 87
MAHLEICYFGNIHKRARKGYIRRGCTGPALKDMSSEQTITEPVAEARPDRPLSEQGAGQSAEQPLRRRIAAGAIILAGVGYVLTLFVMGLSDRNAAQRDFISYWAAGSLAVHGGNPYDPEAVRQLEVGVGRAPGAMVLVMRNPPVALPLVAPLGFLSPKAALIAWLILLIGSFGASIWLLWQMHGRPGNSYHLMAIGFAPALACLMAGQFGVFLLLGVVLFLYFEQRRPALAGAALLLCAFKPHLFVPVAIALALWVVTARKWRVAAGFAGTAAAALGIALSIDPQALTQYVSFMRAGEAAAERIPALSVALRFAISPQSTWIQFVPLVFASAWAAWYFWTNRERWSWADHGMVVLLVAAMCAPYGFLTDECMLLPAVLSGVYTAVERKRSLVPIAVFAGVALIELLAGVEMKTLYFLWTTPAWLAWYLYATRSSAKAESRSASAPAI